MSDEQHVTDLQEEIRQAGRGTRAMRWGTIGCLSVPFLLLALLMVAIVYSGTHLAPPDPPSLTVANVLLDVAQAVGAAALIGLLVAAPAALLYRRARRAGLRRRLAELPPERRSAVLLPLRGERLGDTRKIVAPLLREFGLPTELSPAAAPDGRGDEPSGV